MIIFIFSNSNVEHFLLSVALSRLLDESPFCTSYIMYGYTYSKSKDQPGKVANPAGDQLNRENEYFPVPALA